MGRILVRRYEKKYFLEDLGVDGCVNMKLTLKKFVCKASNWIHLAENMDKQRAVVNTVMNISIS
jgi:hypothetical protein